MRPERSCRTCAAVVGDGFVDALAEGAARGTPAVWIRARASREDGIRTAKVLSEAVISGARQFRVGRGRMMVSGPGQNCAIKER